MSESSVNQLAAIIVATKNYNYFIQAQCQQSIHQF